MTDNACTYYRKSGLGLTTDMRVLTELADLLKMRAWDTPAFDQTSSVQLDLVWDPATKSAVATVKQHNIFLDLNDDDKLRAKRFAEAFTKGPFVYGAETQRCVSACASPQPESVPLAPLARCTPHSHALHASSFRMEERVGLEELSSFVDSIQPNTIEWPSTSLMDIEIEASGLALAI